MNVTATVNSDPIVPNEHVVLALFPDDGRVRLGSISGVMSEADAEKIARERYPHWYSNPDIRIVLIPMQVTSYRTTNNP